MLEVHALEIKEDGNASMFYGRADDDRVATPWHRMGTSVKGLATAAEALKLAGLDWTVTKKPAGYWDDETSSFVNVEDRYCTVRESDKRGLGTVGGIYQVCQNTDAFEFVDNLVDAGEAIFDTAASLYGGKRVFMSAYLPQTIQISGEDAFELYLLFSNSHDGSSAITCTVTPVRVVCRNTELLALRNARTQWSITHRSGLEGKLAEARETLALTHKYVDAFQDEVNKLIDVQVSKDQFKAIIEDCFPKAQTRQYAKNIEGALSFFETSNTLAGYEGTGWGAVQALSEFVEHGRDYRTDESRFKAVMGGWASKAVNLAKDRVLELA